MHARMHVCVRICTRARVIALYYFPLTGKIESDMGELSFTISKSETAHRSQLLSIALRNEAQRETFSPVCRINAAISFISPVRLELRSTLIINSEYTII